MRKFFILTFCFFSYQIHAQNLSLVGVSPSYSQLGKFNKKWGYNLNVTSAINAFSQTVDKKNFPAGQAHLILQGMLVYQITPKLSAAAGYGHGNHNIFGLRETENRLQAQVSYQHKTNSLILNHRGRFEFRSPLNLQTNIRSNASIFRYQIWATYPLYNPRKTKEGFFLSASNETFFYMKGATNGPVSSRNGGLLSENWLHLGGGYNWGSTRVEAGYCFQALVRNKAQDYRFFNLLQLNVYHTINWDDVQFWWYL